MRCRERRYPPAAQALRIEFEVEEIARSMEHAGVDRAEIYAFRKTGMIPFDENLSLFSEAQKIEWRAALAEFEAQQLVGRAGGAA